MSTWLVLWIWVNTNSRAAYLRFLATCQVNLLFETEITKFYRVWRSRSHQDICWFDVPVSDALGMEEGQPLKNMIESSSDFERDLGSESRRQAPWSLMAEGVWAEHACLCRQWWYRTTVCYPPTHYGNEYRYLHAIIFEEPRFPSELLFPILAFWLLHSTDVAMIIDCLSDGSTCSKSDYI